MCPSVLLRTRPFVEVVYQISVHVQRTSLAIGHALYRACVVSASLIGSCAHAFFALGRRLPSACVHVCGQAAVAPFGPVCVRMRGVFVGMAGDETGQRTGTGGLEIGKFGCVCVCV